MTEVASGVLVPRLVPTRGTVPLPGRSELAALLEGSGLTGRGGAAFPTHRKLAAFLGHPDGTVVLVGNGMEGEPLSRKDQHLLTTAPGLVLDGLAVVGHALGVRRTVLAVGAQVDTTALRAEVARRTSGVELLVLPDRFVSGQESALVNAVDGRAPVPGPRHLPVRERGVGRQPTLVLNVETLAGIAVLVRDPSGPDTCLVTVSGSRPGVVARPGVLEVERRTPVREVLARTGTDPQRVAAVLVGGFHGAWRTDPDVPLADATPGAGVLHVLDRADCPLAVTAGFVDFLAGQSAGQCGPCVNGLPALAGVLRELTHGTGAGDPARLTTLCDLVERRGACAHPDGTARLVRSTLAVFADHVRAHVAGRCPR